VQAGGRVLLLPLPVDVVDLGVVEVEEGFCLGGGVLDGGLENTNCDVLCRFLGVAD
jgi:hypothetical protein